MFSFINFNLHSLLECFLKNNRAAEIDWLPVVLLLRGGTKFGAKRYAEWKNISSYRAGNELHLLSEIKESLFYFVVNNNWLYFSFTWKRIFFFPELTDSRTEVFPILRNCSYFQFNFEKHWLLLKTNCFCRNSLPNALNFSQHSKGLIRQQHDKEIAYHTQNSRSLAKNVKSNIFDPFLFWYPSGYFITQFPTS